MEKPEKKLSLADSVKRWLPPCVLSLCAGAFIVVVLAGLLTEYFTSGFVIAISLLLFCVIAGILLFARSSIIGVLLNALDQRKTALDIASKLLLSLVLVAFLGVQGNRLAQEQNDFSERETAAVMTLTQFGTNRNAYRLESIKGIGLPESCILTKVIACSMEMSMSFSFMPSGELK